MSLYELSDATKLRLRELVDASFERRDSLYAAADALADDSRRSVCRHLAEDLAGYAAELEQILLGAGDKAVEPMEHSAEATEQDSGDRRHDAPLSEAQILGAAEDGERRLKQRYNEAIEVIREVEAQGVVRRQRDGLAFGEQVLHAMHHPTNDGPDVESTP